MLTVIIHDISSRIDNTMKANTSFKIPVFYVLHS